MQCAACGTTPRDSRVATAVCSECGAATCAEHTHEVRIRIPASSVGNPVVRTARRLRCSECTRLAEPLEQARR